jgi:uncharacterized membrane protein YkgB
MIAHRFDPLSAVLGIVAVITGVLVMLGSTDPLSTNLGPWLTLGALAIGVALLPWSRRHRKTTTHDDA